MATGREGMEMTMEYPVKDVLVALRKNRSAHAAEYERAMVSYRSKRKRALSEAKRIFLRNYDEMRAVEDSPKEIDYDLSQLLDSIEVDVGEPASYLSHYDDYIEQLEMTSQDKIEFSRKMFKQLVQNDWDWKHSWERTSALYLPKAGG